MGSARDREKLRKNHCGSEYDLAMVIVERLSKNEIVRDGSMANKK